MCFCWTKNIMARWDIFFRWVRPVMNNKSLCNLAGFRRPSSLRWTGIAQAGALLSGMLALCLLMGPTPACANDAPAWMHALVNVPLPEHDDKTDAVMLYSEHILT